MEIQRGSGRTVGGTEGFPGDMGRTSLVLNACPASTWLLPLGSAACHIKLMATFTSRVPDMKGQ